MVDLSSGYLEFRDFLPFQKLQNGLEAFMPPPVHPQTLSFLILALRIVRETLPESHPARRFNLDPEAAKPRL